MLYRLYGDIILDSNNGEENGNYYVLGIYCWFWGFWFGV